MNAIRSTFLLSSLFCILTTMSSAQSRGISTSIRPYADQIRTFREEQEADLKKDEGWLSLVGLFWLHAGDNSIGSAKTADVVLPETVSPHSVGKIEFIKGKVIIALDDTSSATVNDTKVVGNPTLNPDISGNPDKVKMGTVTMMVIVRGNRTGIRMSDTASKARTEFKGMKWFKPSQEYRIIAKFHSYNPPHKLLITNVLGDTSPVSSPGFVTFRVKGHECRLETQSAGKGLFINFHDLTSGKETYPAGRFLETDGPINGVVVVDFNRAINPPCAFTNFATCPLAPRANYLNVRIPAGELAHHPH